MKTIYGMPSALPYSPVQCRGINCGAILNPYWYVFNRYLKWLTNNFKKVFLSIDIVLLIFILFLLISHNYIINTILFDLLDIIKSNIKST